MQLYFLVFMCFVVATITFLVTLLIFWKPSYKDQVPKDKYASPVDFCNELIAGFKLKAQHNKNESMWFFLVTMAGSLLAPLLVTLGGDNFWISKVIPSVLSGVVALGTAWLQLRKPQHLWALYRGCQRKLEDNLARYKFRVGEYSAGDVNNLLAQRCAEIAMEAHNEWLPIMPKGEKTNPGGSNNP
jgi:hypothetical protein